MVAIVDNDVELLPLQSAAKVYPVLLLRRTRQVAVSAAVALARVQRLAKTGEPGVGVEALGKGPGLVEQRNFFEQARDVGAFVFVVEVHVTYLAIRACL